MLPLTAGGLFCPPKNKENTNESTDFRVLPAKREAPPPPPTPLLDGVAMKRYLTVNAFAEAASMHPVTVRRMIYAGEIKATQRDVHAHWRIPVTELNRLMEGAA